MKCWGHQKTNGFLKARKIENFSTALNTPRLGACEIYNFAVQEIHLEFPSTCKKFSFFLRLQIGDLQISKIFIKIFECSGKSEIF